MVYCIKRIKQTVVYITTLCVCLTLLACVPLESDPPEATNIPLPTHTPPVPTATIDWFPPATPTNISPSKTSPAEQDNPEPAPNREVLFEDDFSDETLWQTYNEAAYKVIYEPNALSVVVLGEKVEAESLSAYILPGNFYLEFTVETALCSENDRYGIVFWRNSVSGTYRFGPTARGGSLWLTVFCLRG